MTDVVEVDAAESAPGAPGRNTVLDTLRRSWRQLTSMRVALILLFLLALVAVPGSLFPQRGASPQAVASYMAQHPGASVWLNRLGMFDVYASAWFAAVYLLLFISLVGCVVPRLRTHLATVRTPPPVAPRNLHRLDQSASYTTHVPADVERARLAGAMRARHWRTVVRDDAVCAEKGFVREWGNLLFHYALVLLLIGIATGGLFGYKGSVVVLEGQTFANTPVQYNAFDHGRAVDVRGLPPFSLRLDSFSASYLPNGQASDFSAAVTWRPDGATAPRTAVIGPDHPLGLPSGWLDGPTNVYLIGHGYAVHVVVKDPTGAIVYDDTQPARPVAGDNNLTSTGAVKIPTAKPEQLGIAVRFVPTTVVEGTDSTFPAPQNPTVTLTAFHGDLNESAGGQTIYELDTTKMTMFQDTAGPLTKTLSVGQSWQLPNGFSATFAGFSNWTQLSINHDPGKRTALLGAILMVIGLLLSLFVSRRRIWLRVTDGGTASVVEVGGLSRREGDSFEEEFADLVRDLSAPANEEERP